MITETYSPPRARETKADSHLLLDPSALIGLLERERDALTRENKALRVGLDRLIETASASADMVLPLVAEDISHCTRELSLAKGRLAMAVTGGHPGDVVAELVRRKDSLEKELDVARELLAEATRIAPLLNELRMLAGFPVKPSTPEVLAAMEMQFAPRPVSRPEDILRIPAEGKLPERKLDLKKLGSAQAAMSRTPSIPVKPAEPVESLHLKAPVQPATPSSTKAASFGSSLFGKLFGR